MTLDSDLGAAQHDQGFANRRHATTNVKRLQNRTQGKKDPHHLALADAVSLLLNCLLVASMYHYLNFRLSVSTFPDFWSVCFLFDTWIWLKVSKMRMTVLALLKISPACSGFCSQLTSEFLLLWSRYFSSSSTSIIICSLEEEFQSHVHTHTMMLWKNIQYENIWVMLIWASMVISPYKYCRWWWASLLGSNCWKGPPLQCTCTTAGLERGPGTAGSAPRSADKTSPKQQQINSRTFWRAFLLKIYQCTSTRVSKKGQRIMFRSFEKCFNHKSITDKYHILNHIFTKDPLEYYSVKKKHETKKFNPQTWENKMKTSACSFFDSRAVQKKKQKAESAPQLRGTFLSSGVQCRIKSLKQYASSPNMAAVQSAAHSQRCTQFPLPGGSPGSGSVHLPPSACINTALQVLASLTLEKISPPRK